jgi:hypothetical protein
MNESQSVPVICAANVYNVFLAIISQVFELIDRHGTQQEQLKTYNRIKS